MKIPAYDTDLTDDQWTLVEPMLPPPQLPLCRLVWLDLKLSDLSSPVWALCTIFRASSSLVRLPFKELSQFVALPTLTAQPWLAHEGVKAHYGLVGGVF